MTLIAIRSVPSSDGSITFRAVAADAHSEGATPGQALDALAAALPPSASQMLLVQSFDPDSFFSEGKYKRMQTLMHAWRSARDAGKEFPREEQAELQRLIDEELEASAARTTAVAAESDR